MAHHVIEKLIDDIDGGDAVETVAFGLDGTAYEIDLSKKNAVAFRKVLDRYTKAGRRATSSARSTSTRPGRSARRDAAPSTTGTKSARRFDVLQLREWAGANDVPVPSRGRIPNAVVEQYIQAGGR